MPRPTSWSRGLSKGLGFLLDPTIVLSFGRLGYQVQALGFDPADLSTRLEGQVCLVTGANSGIGLETARALARAGGEVHLLCRRQEAGPEAEARIRQETGNQAVFAWQVDMSSLKSIRAFVAAFDRPQVARLVHNAGVLPDQRLETADGLELTFATNLLGPFALTQALEPRLKVAPSSRVIWVSSGGMYPQKLDIPGLTCPPEPFDGVKAYANTKRAMVILSELWAQRWRGSRVTSFSMHPGWADTQAVRSSLPRFWKLTQHMLRSPQEGADTVVWLALKEGLEARSGQFFFDRQPRATHLLPWTRETAEAREALWALLEASSQM